MNVTRSLIIALCVCQATAAIAIAGERSALHDPATASPVQTRASQHVTNTASVSASSDPLDRVADAVDGAESSHGKDPAMWQPDPDAPQGPMQVSEAAATDVGGGDRFDIAQNRALGRAYLSRLYWRYRNWPDAIAAYNWGIGKMDAWVKAGRPREQFLVGVTVYLQRVLHDSGLCNGVEIAAPRRLTSSAGKVEIRAQPVVSPPESLVSAACTAPDPAGGALGLSTVTNRFYKQLDAALQLAVRRAAQDR
jgi:Transglycosylase SLT domain